MRGWEFVWEKQPARSVINNIVHQWSRLCFGDGVIHGMFTGDEALCEMREANRQVDHNIGGQGQDRRGRWTDSWRLSGGGERPCNSECIRKRQEREKKEVGKE